MEQAVFSQAAFAAAARQTAAEGCVLLRNEGRALPLRLGDQVAVFGRAQMNYFKSGLGSGGKVNARYVTGVWEALRAEEGVTLDTQVRAAYEQWTEQHPYDMGDGWAGHPWFQQEMPLPDDFVSAAAARNDAAIILIGRAAGEDRDNADAPGSWRLTQDEERLLEQVCGRFSRSIVLLNVGNIIDMSWVERYRPAAVMYIWQGGQEGGSGVADVLSGRLSPCGRLSDTIALSAADYPCADNFANDHRCVYAEDIYVGYRYFETFAKERVLYPFGSGLSYTAFRHEPVSFVWDGECALLRHRVTNAGPCAAKEVVQAYAVLPQGKLGQPALTLVGFAKTETLQPGEGAEIEIRIPADRIASYDDSGVSGHKSCWLLEEGEYHLLCGHDSHDLMQAGTFRIEKTRVLAELEEACAPVEAFCRMRPDNMGGMAWEAVPLRTVNPAERRLERLPQEMKQQQRGLTLTDVTEGRCTMAAFIAQLNDDDLCTIVRGEGMNSPRVTPGTAGAIGGVSSRLAALGLPAACCADGPSGIRMDCGNKAFSMPSGTCQACTWNESLIAELYAYEGMEMRKYQVDLLLGPGMNIHRSPLCGRNFEYFSEDPLLTGRMASAQLAGLHESGVTGVIKHFACNNQEQRRSWVNAVVSERALRQIYLKGFEIAVKEGGANAVMTAYNPLNGCWTASHYDLTTTILRDEWGFDGIVMSDWWAMGSEEGAAPSTKMMAAMVRAQNDLFMVCNEPEANSGNDDSAESLAKGTVTRAEYQRSAANICRFLLTTPAWRRSTGQESGEDETLRQLRDEEGDVILSVPEVCVDTEVVIPGTMLDTGAGRVTLLQMKLAERGAYRIEITCRASAAMPDMAQLPLYIHVDGALVGSRVLSGREHEWQTICFETPAIRSRLSFHLQFLFAVGGMEVQQVRIVRTQSFQHQGSSV